MFDGARCVNVSVGVEAKNQIASPVAQTDQRQRRKKDAATRWRKLLEDLVPADCRWRRSAANAGSQHHRYSPGRRRLLLHGREIFKPVRLAAEHILDSQ